MTLTTEELQRLVDEATADAEFNASLADMAESLGGNPDQFKDMEVDCNRIAYLARRVLAAEKMAEAARDVDDIIIYRIRKPRGMAILEGLLETLPDMVDA